MEQTVPADVVALKDTCTKLRPALLDILSKIENVDAYTGSEFKLKGEASLREYDKLSHSMDTNANNLSENIKTYLSFLPYVSEPSMLKPLQDELESLTEGLGTGLQHMDQSADFRKLGNEIGTLIDDINAVVASKNADLDGALKDVNQRVTLAEEQVKRLENEVKRKISRRHTEAIQSAFSGVKTLTSSQGQAAADEDPESAVVEKKKESKVDWSEQGARVLKGLGDAEPDDDDAALTAANRERGQALEAQKAIAAQKRSRDIANWPVISAALNKIKMDIMNIALKHLVLRKVYTLFEAELKGYLAVIDAFTKVDNQDTQRALHNFHKKVGYNQPKLQSVQEELESFAHTLK